MKRTLSLIFILTLLTGSVFASAWPQKRGHGYYRIGFRMIRADQFYEPDGTKVDIATLSEYTTTLYGEHGLSNRLTLVASVPVFKRVTLNRQVGTSGFVYFAGDAKNGIADTDVGLRFGLLQNNSTVLSAELLLGLPVGDHDHEHGLLTGDGEFNQHLKLQFGYSFYPTAAYVTGEIGVNQRSEGYSDEFHYTAELGYWLTPWLLASFKLRGVESFENGVDTVLGGAAGLYGNDQRYLAYGPEVAFLFTPALGMSLAVEGATRGRHIPAAPAFSLALFLKR